MESVGRRVVEGVTAERVAKSRHALARLPYISRIFCRICYTHLLQEQDSIYLNTRSYQQQQSEFFPGAPRIHSSYHLSVSPFLHSSFPSFLFSPLSSRDISIHIAVRIRDDDHAGYFQDISAEGRKEEFQEAYTEGGEELQLTDSSLVAAPKEVVRSEGREGREEGMGSGCRLD